MEETNGLVQFDKEEVTIRTRNSKIPFFKDPPPFIEQTPTQILSREYAAGVFDFTNSGTKFHKVSIPQFADPVFLSALKSFRYLRWLMCKWRIQVMAVPQVYGAVLATCVPQDNRRSAGVLETDFGWASHKDAVWCDMSTMNEAEISVPWISYSTWYDTIEGSMDNVKYQTDLKLFCPNWVYSTDSSIPRSCSVMVWCELVYPQTTGAIQPEAEMQTAAFYKVLLEQAQRYMANEGLGHFAGSVKEGFNTVDDWAGDWFDFDDPAAETEAAESSLSVIPDVYGDTNFSRPRGTLGPMIGATSNTKNRIYDFIKIPSLHETLVDTTGVSRELSGFPFGYRGSLFNPYRCDRMDFAGRYFRLWRGSFIYTLMFFSSPLIVHKYIIKMQYQDNPVATVGNIITKIVTVKGTTVERIEVPYLRTLPWARVDGSTIMETPTITISRYVPTRTAGDSSPTCLVLVYKHAGEDFKFLSQQDPQDGPKIEMQAAVKEFRFMKGGAVAGTAECSTGGNGPQYFEDLAKRWASRPDFSFNALNYLGDLTQPWEWTTSDCIRSIFLFNKGSYKVRIKFNPADLPEEVNPDTMICIVLDGTWYPGELDSIPLSMRWANGSRVVSFGLTQVIEFTVPFVCESEWIGTWDSYGHLGISPTLIEPHLYFPELGVGIPVTFSMFSMGDDFVMSYDLPPPWSSARWYNKVPTETDTQAGVFSLIGEPKRTNKQRLANSSEKKIDRVKNVPVATRKVSKQ